MDKKDEEVLDNFYRALSEISTDLFQMLYAIDDLEEDKRHILDSCFVGFYPFNASYDEFTFSFSSWVEELRNLFKKDSVVNSSYKNKDMVENILNDINSLPSSEQYNVLKSLNTLIGINSHK